MNYPMPAPAHPSDPAPRMLNPRKAKRWDIDDDAVCPICGAEPDTQCAGDQVRRIGG